MERRSIEAKDYSHKTGIPTGSRIGPLLASSVIVGFDPGTRNLPSDGVDQVANVYRHVGAILEAAGASWEHVAKMTFHITEADLKDAVEAEWLQRFPDPDSRPARFTNIKGGDSPLKVQGEFLAYITD
jgi:enamine deaminase RidA (YjgF/YER057c/UK114 family)